MQAIEQDTPAKPVLSEKHRQLLFTESQISPEIAAAREYRSITKPTELRALGFSQSQSASVPGLLIPYTDAQGETFHQYRPDRKQKDRPKYETPFKREGEAPPYGLDVPPTVREQVLNSECELWITEGARKADALVTAGLVAVSLPGVWMFLRSNKPLPDFYTILLSGRVVVICYDSDAMTKESVYGALRRLSNLLKKCGAIVRYCYLPDDGEQKMGADDYLAAGHSAEELRGLVTERLKPVATAPAKALINTLNRKFEGKATFRENRLDIAGDGGQQEAFDIIHAVFNQMDSVDVHMKLWIGDACRSITWEHGTKIATLDAVFGKGRSVQIRKLEWIAKRFSDERDYFRDAAPIWFLEAIAGSDLTDEQQDDLLTEYLCSGLSRDAVRERVAEMTGKKTEHSKSAKGEGEPSQRVSFGEVLSLLFFQMSPEDRQKLEEAERVHGKEFLRQRMKNMVPDALHYLVEKTVQTAEEDARRDDAAWASNYSPYIDRGEEEETPYTTIEMATESLPVPLPLPLPEEPADNAPNDSPANTLTPANEIEPPHHAPSVAGLKPPPLLSLIDTKEMDDLEQAIVATREPQKPPHACWKCETRPALGTIECTHFCAECDRINKEEEAAAFAQVQAARQVQKLAKMNHST
jgi:hypothetical protein